MKYLTRELWKILGIFQSFHEKVVGLKNELPSFIRTTSRPTLYIVTFLFWNSFFIDINQDEINMKKGRDEWNGHILSGQTLALAEPEARHYNHPVTDIRPLLNRYPASAPRSKCLYWLYLSHFSTDWAEILHDCYLGGKDEVCRQNIDPAALQYSMQHCRISNRTITQPFLIGLSWNLAWLLLRYK